MHRDRHRLLHLLEIATVGVPFCVFKLLTGWLLLTVPAWRLVGGALLALGALDLALNAVGFVLTLAGRGGRLGVCTFQQAMAMARPGQRAWSEFGLSLDAMLAFTLVALMIGLGLLQRLPPRASHAWSTAVVLSVLGAGIGRLAESLAELREDGVSAR